MSDKNKSNDCDDPQQQPVLQLAEAIEKVLEACPVINESEIVELGDAGGRVLAEVIVAPRDVPGFDNSAMDGYALASADLPDSGSKTIQLVGKALAGKPYKEEVGKNQCVRITTGGVMPTGTDTVVMQEHVELLGGDEIKIDDRHRPKQHVRYADNDIAKDSPVLAAGKCLSAADLGVIASLGIDRVAVYRRVKVAFFSSGDEIKTLEESLEPGEIYNSSRYSIGALITQAGAELRDTQVLRDHYDAIKTALSAATREVDVIITTGGVSVGEADYIKDVFDEIGEIGFWKLAMKPGRPLAFGKSGHCVFFGLPGNPVSSMATFMQIVEPALHKISGRDPMPEKITLSAIASEDIKKRPGRIDFQRGILSFRDGAYHVTTTGTQSSGQLSSMSIANCFVVLPLEASNISAGDPVTVQPFTKHH